MQLSATTKPANIGPIWPQGDDLITKLKENETIETIDLYCKENPGYKLDYSLSQVGPLAHVLLGQNGPVDSVLLSHILQVGGLAVLDGGNKYGFTPLLFSISIASIQEKNLIYKEPKRTKKKVSMVITAIALCHLGADVNLTNTHFSHDLHRPKKITALWLAAENTHSLDLVKMLLCCGADLGDNELSEEGASMITKAQNHINEICINKIFEEKDRPHSLLHQVPNELLPLIVRYNVSLLREEIAVEYLNYCKAEKLPQQALFLNFKQK